MARNYVKIAKQHFVSSLVIHFQAKEKKTREHYFNEACTIEMLLRDFGVNHDEIKALEEFAKEIQGNFRGNVDYPIFSGN